MKNIQRSRSAMIRRGVFLLVSFFVIAFSVMVGLNLSWGWFAKSEGASSSGLQVVAKTGSYDILIERTEEYDRQKGSPAITVYDGIAELKTQLGSDGFSLRDTNTNVSSLLAFELVNEFDFTEHDDYINGEITTYYLMPGAYGKLTFYIRPRSQAVNPSMTFSLDLGGFYGEETQSGFAIRRTESEDALTLLRGHLLFFTERDDHDHPEHPENFVYGGLIEDGTFTYDTRLHSLCSEEGKTDCYEITLYWEWPETYFDISSNISTAQTTKKYPAALQTVIANHSNYFFATNQNSHIESELGEGYDDGDQKIGNYIQYVAAYVTLHE